MKHVSSILLLAIALIFSIGISPKSLSAETGDKVLIIIRERYGSADLQFMATNEAILMKQTLEEAGFKVDIASASGRKFWRRRVTNEEGVWIEKVALESDYKLGEVNVDNYIGFMITCSALGENISIDREQVLAFGETYIKPEEVAIAKKIVDSGKPIAAQSKGVVILAEAGVLKGKKYSYQRDLQLDDAIYGGQDVVKDGNIMTSSECPAGGPKDQTVELTKALIDAIQE
jgi:putative intracellular protease/amidase